MPARRAVLILAAVLALAGMGCGDDKKDTAATATTEATPPAPPTRSKPKITVPKGPAPTKLVVKDLIKGSGPPAKAGDQLTVNYVGVLYRGGREFDASYGGAPFPFQLGTGQVIPGWDKGLVGMQAGGRRELIIPPRDAYGSRGAPPDIPPNAALIFVVDLLSIG
jgi:FKBP-type peptidyl-prolyl cis-trans isomerase